MQAGLKPTADINHTRLEGIAHGAEAYALAQLVHGNVAGVDASTDILHVSPSDRQMDMLERTLSFFAPNARILTFPAWNCLPYDRVSPSAALLAERVRTLTALATRKKGQAPLIVLTTVNAMLQRVPAREVFASTSFTLKKGERIDRDALAEFLLASGYRRAGKAIEPGEFALRGSLIDIVPPGENEGLRFDFFGDEIESVRSFDPLSQISAAEADGTVLHAVSEIMLNEETVQRFRTRYREAFGSAQNDPLYEAISHAQSFPGMEHWLPLFYAKTETLADYLPDALITLEQDSEKAMEERWETIQDYFQARRDAENLRSKTLADAPYHPLAPEELYLMEANWDIILDRTRHAEFSAFDNDGGKALSLHTRPGANLAALRSGQAINPYEQLKEFVAEKRSQGKSTLLGCYSTGSRERLADNLGKVGLHAVMCESFAEGMKISGKSVGLAIAPLERGFETEKLALVAEADLLGDRSIRSSKKKRKSEAFLAEAANFLEGELVVHREHGIGRFEGLVTIEAAGGRHDCLKLLYEGDDRLFLPVENIDLLTRYGLEDEAVKLDKLGAASWQSRKARLKERIKIAAEALLKIAAERQLRQGATLEAETTAYDRFIEGFPYAETDDQQRSIDEVLEDLKSGKPMDRLVCGDVGFGKTEVALRAAFAAVSSEQKMQVALIVPTTLLARQHYRNFAERFKHTNLVVRQLSRMVPAKEQKATREGMEDGSVDIVIGTHAVLSKSVKFKNLGLLIVDEEQHFGVGQKEKIKELKSDVHVLTLSATPIPRTLQMALSGVRDLSLITTPPVDRLAVRSFVMPFDPVVIREALLREQHRGGRSFVVCPRIKDIPEIKVQLEQLVPELKLVVAHGQMSPSDLDKIMNDFYDGKYDVLISTAIIESGLDIPTANTMIIHRADRFGLSQLYQLRGRVGRGKIRAYAYFLLPARKQLTKQATRRLEVMQSLDALGAGFTLASHDMDIRGCGNLVGDEQSGHIREVGVELYQQMLADMVEKLKRTSLPQAHAQASVDDDWTPQINLGLSVLIPEEYVGDLALRMGLYKRAAHLESMEEIDAFAAELIDRFGPLPEEAAHLLDTVRIKYLCRQAGVERVDVGPKGAVFSFHGNAVRAPEKLLAFVASRPTQMKLRPDGKLAILREWSGPRQKIREVCSLLEQIFHSMSS